MTDLAYSLDRTITIRAPREFVFRFLSTSEFWSKWWGPGSSIDARPGGAMKIRYPNGVEAGGKVIECVPPDRIVFTFGYASGQPMGIGESTVTISLTSKSDETMVALHHDLADATLRDQHVQGWRYQLSTFANTVTGELHSGAAQMIDAWFEAWVDPDDARRQAEFDRLAIASCEYRDKFSALSGTEEISTHAGAAQRFMPGFRIRRSGDVKHCNGVVLADWVTEGGPHAGNGTTMFVFSPSGKIEWATGFWP
jgi:uncharacterized protein YndB with AHSA1/START domain